MTVASLPSDPALRKRVDWLTKKVIRLAAKSATTRPYESLEYHLVHWKRPWPQALTTMEEISPRVAALVRDVVLDSVETDDGRPMGDPLAALPVDLLTCAEALALQDQGFHFEVATRFWPGVDGAPADDHHGRARSAKKRAGNKAFTYYRSTGDAFVYARSLPRSLRISNP